MLESIGLTDKQRAILQRGADQARAAKEPAEQERILTATMGFFQKSLTAEQQAKLEKLRRDVRDSGPFLAAGLTEAQKAVIRKAQTQADQAPTAAARDAMMLGAFDQVEATLSEAQKQRLKASAPKVQPGSMIGLDEKQKAVMYDAQRRARSVRDAEGRKKIMRAAWEQVRKTFTPEQQRRNLGLLLDRVLQGSPLRGMPLTAEQFQTIQKAFDQAVKTTDRRQRGSIMAGAFDAVAQTLPKELQALYQARKQTHVERARRKAAPLQ